MNSLTLMTHLAGISRRSVVPSFDLLQLVDVE
jgi:hypothetical protein